MSIPVIVPGLHDSGSDHWQTWFERCMPSARRVRQKNWSLPDLDGWSNEVIYTLPSTVRSSVIVAHSFGCLASVAAARRAGRQIAGAILVAPADPFRLEIDDRAVDLILPFPSVVVASTNDPWISFERASHFARLWGSEILNVGKAGHINVESGFGPWPIAFGLMAIMERAGPTHRNAQPEATAGPPSPLW